MQSISKLTDIGNTTKTQGFDGNVFSDNDGDCNNEDAPIYPEALIIYNG